MGFYPSRGPAAFAAAGAKYSSKTPRNELLRQMTVEEKAVRVAAVHALRSAGPPKTIPFGVPVSLLAYTDLSGDLVMEPGPVEVSAGSSFRRTPYE
jgi:hypothetical protein